MLVTWKEILLKAGVGGRAREGPFGLEMKNFTSFGFALHLFWKRLIWFAVSYFKVFWFIDSSGPLRTCVVLLQKYF